MVLHSSFQNRLLLLAVFILAFFSLVAGYSSREERETIAGQAAGGNATESKDQPKVTPRLDSRQASEMASSSKFRDSGSSDWLGLIGALGGAIVGGFIGWGAALSAARKAEQLAKQRQQRSEEEQRRIVREMLGIEIELNLTMLSDDMYMTDIERRPSDRSGIEWLAVHPCPRWSTTVWDRSVLLLSPGLSEKQVKAVQYLYCCLHSITVARESLSSVYLRTEKYQNSIRFYERARELADAAIRLGNPLRGSGDSPGTPG